jgi:CHRD domain
MRRLIVCLVAACAAAVPATSVAKRTTTAKSGGGTMCVLHAKLSANNETTGSTSTAKGHTLVKVRNDGTIQFKTQIHNGGHETFVAGHVHQAPAGVAGPVVVPLFVPPAPATSARHIKQRGTATPNAGTTGADMCQNPSAYYVNYHTTAFPGGAIRGQLH